ncbi:unnamed protein product [Rotaria socialis]
MGESCASQLELNSEQELQNRSDNSDEETLTSGSDGSSFSSQSDTETPSSDDKDTDLSSTNYFEQLYDNLFEALDCIDQNDQIDKSQLAFDVSSYSTSSRSSVSSDFTYLDEVESFFNTNDTFVQTSTSGIMLFDQHHNDFGSTAARNKIFVGCIPLHIDESSLRSFFNRIGYLDLVHVNGPKFKNNRLGFAFITFASNTTVSEILCDYDRTPEKFKLLGRQLQLNSPKLRVPPKMQTDDAQSTRETDSHLFTFALDSVMYGTLIGMAAMRNLVDERCENATASTLTYGYIVHQQFNTLPEAYFLSIDTKQKKFYIDVKLIEKTEKWPKLTGNFRFEWSFRDLKGNKFVPVLIHGLSSSNLISSNNSIDSSVYILCEIRRAPFISYVQRARADSSHNEIRLPGSTLLGRANAWLLRIGSDPKIYQTFANLLDRHRLSAKHCQASNMVPLLTSVLQHSQQFIHINLLLMKEWQEKNRLAIARFSSQRWPYFPFQTKFEIMKLISKHIITVNDLILDERLEFILRKMSSNTLAACVDKIIEFAPHWQPTSEKSNDEDWNDEEEEGGKNEESTIRTYHVFPPIFSADGKPLNTAASTSIAIDLTRIKLQDLYHSNNDRIGSLSRLLCLGLIQLRRKHQLDQTVSGIYVTKREMRAFKSIETFSIRKVYITPSTINYEGPHFEEACAVIRHFSELQDCFLRVSFLDEDYRMLKNLNNSMNIVYKHIEKLMIDGLNVCGRQYKFLAFSSSQLREHSCWMFHQQHISNISCDAIREWMGDFQNIHPVAKMAARLGQSFSTTIKGKELSRESYIEIDDVTSSIDSKAIYTDGIGIIASWFADELSKQMNLDSTPSAFQIRFAGYKGMVCVSLEDKICNDSKIRVAFRPSMKKFDSDNCSIDIVHPSDFSSSYLNRQIILLLSSRRISDSVFHHFQDEMLAKLRFINTNVDHAIEALWKFNGNTGGNGTHKMMIEYLSRFQLNTEPFIPQLLFRFQAFQLKQLRTKARILIEKGCVLFGVADETRTLKYGQVFIQIHRSDINETKIIQGPVIVTRNPCLYPGDIRRYEAVDNLQLHKLKNVIVFPMDGPRSMAAELAGGDLDGDTFWISWDSHLIFADNYKAFCYSDQARQANESAANTSKQSYTMADICRFFVEYMKADNLGIIANWHLARADRNGVENENCMKLAEMHSIAVDFVKTGNRPPTLTKDLQPKTYPHFMEKKDKPDHSSTSILGQLYDEVKKFKIDSNQNKDLNKKPFPYRTLIIDGYLSYITDARILKEEYDRELRRIMRHYGLHRESEIISGYIIKFMSKQYAKRGKIFELRNEITNAIRSLRNKYIQIFWQEFYQLSMEDENVEPDFWKKVSQQLSWHNQLVVADYYEKHSIYVEQKASAWFYVTYKEELNNHGDMTNQQGRLYSFAWLVYPVLLHIYDCHRNDDKTSFEIRHKKRNNNRRRRRRKYRRKN